MCSIRILEKKNIGDLYYEPCTTVVYDTGIKYGTVVQSYIQVELDTDKQLKMKKVDYFSQEN